MQNCFCGENIKLISDVIDSWTLLKNPYLILLGDFEKAFDKISWNFLHCCLKRFGLALCFKKGFLYSTITSRVVFQITGISQNTLKFPKVSDKAVHSVLSYSCCWLKLLLLLL